ncbi:hypothetical protein KFE25_007729 [Diacronema lutheri]|uniref:Uncharacterized protein n=1 Tax=Diacronema lutheri TaxID=2081491 RepID=A0A8J5XHU0_DIALT|nr:hypothetical protein KFE25_007729 [Diacronema lutheri]
MVVGARSVTLIESDEAFERHVLADSRASLFLFTSSSSEASAARSTAALDMLHDVGAALSPLLTTAHGDAGVLKATATEFNIRTRRCPKLLLFAQRARQAEVLDLGDDLSGGRVESQVRALLAGLAIAADGAALKATLAVGGPADEL